VGHVRSLIKLLRPADVRQGRDSVRSVPPVRYPKGRKGDNRRPAASDRASSASENRHTSTYSARKYPPLFGLTGNSKSIPSDPSHPSVAADYRSVRKTSKSEFCVIENRPWLPVSSGPVVSHHAHHTRRSTRTASWSRLDCLIGCLGGLAWLVATCSVGLVSFLTSEARRIACSRRNKTRSIPSFVRSFPLSLHCLVVVIG
jgi:hypothetical protein